MPRTPTPAREPERPVVAAEAGIAARAPAAARPYSAEREAAPAAATRAESSGLSSSDDLFAQLRSRILEAEDQARRHAELEQEIERLRGVIELLEDEANARVAAARAETDDVRAELQQLKAKIRALVSND